MESNNHAGPRRYNRRKFGHDYYGPFIYHIIFKKLKDAPEFGQIVGSAKFPPGSKGAARVNYSKMGYAIFNALKEFEAKFPEFKKKQYSIMPDHIHIIFQKLYRTSYHLEEYMDFLKDMIACNYHFKERCSFLEPNQIFEESFTDKLLYDDVSLLDWEMYVAQNPHRKAMIMENPEFFQIKRGLVIDGRKMEAYGNIFHINNPDKHPVRIRRSDSEEVKKEKIRIALKKAAEGAVLVSPFISDYEKRIKDAAEAIGGKFIWLTCQEFGEKYKPERSKFNLCSQGRLLIISLCYPRTTNLTYTIATEMNELAARIAELNFSHLATENRGDWI